MLLIGSDCSGMCTEAHALDLLGIPYTHLFCSEIWEPAIRCIRSNHRPKVIYRDMTERDLSSVPDVDLYVCGFPCCPNSVMNLKRHTETSRDPMTCALEYIKTKRPEYWVLENVTGLMTVDKGRVWNALVEELDALEGYSWDYRILDPCKHANSPQSRPRIYMCGRVGTDRIEWPEEVPLTTRCVDLLDPTAQGQDAAPCYKGMLKAWGITPEQEGIIEFCAASRAYSPYKKDAKPLTDRQRSNLLKTDISPCVIKHDPGPYANHLQRFLTGDECLRLQGFDPAKVRKPQVTPLQLRSLCGNAMHCGVLAKVLEKLIRA